MKKSNLIQNQPIPRQSFKEPLNPRTYTQNHTSHQGTRGGYMEPLPRVFDMLQCFEAILPSLKSL